MTRWWYLSFADTTGFLGGAIVRGDRMIAAVREAHRQGCNPGGEVQGWPLGDIIDVAPEEFRNRLLSKAEINQAFETNRSDEN